MSVEVLLQLHFLLLSYLVHCTSFAWRRWWRRRSLAVVLGVLETDLCWGKQQAGQQQTWCR